MGAVAAMMIILVFLNLGAVATAHQEVSNFARLFSTSSNLSSSTTLDDKRGVPTGANPLHNR
ncbi:hypothetical protein MANES_12G118802v8 [Manihot esculenta]|uniref:Uncharacterized protein n=1 Tax=Manihot esculenta TaxID=3983 RepID=A0ACB7GS24_MANES|nr:hypothetical protein MANES_12G118802v8 [Manihot esculenta]